MSAQSWQMDAQWVICGGRIAPGVFRLIASRSLTDGVVIADDDRMHRDAWAPMRIVCEIAARPHSYLIVEGPSYQACLAELMASWQPDPSAPAELPEPRLPE